MAAAYPRAHHPGGDDVRRLSLCLGPRHVRPTEEVRVSSRRLLQGGGLADRLRPSPRSVSACEVSPTTSGGTQPKAYDKSKVTFYKA